MIIALIGHRGSGKSTCLRRWQKYFEQNKRPARFVDLDEEIEKNYHTTINDIFNKKGEKIFREIEKTIFFAVYEQGQKLGENLFIALGAGFSFDLPQDVYAIWVQRETDLDPRTFFSRPRLNKRLLPSEEYLEAAYEREKKFEKVASEKILIPEQVTWDREREENLEQRFLFADKIQVGAITTVSKNLLRCPIKLDYWLSRRAYWIDMAYEVRTDLLDSVEFNQALKTFRPGIVGVRSLNDDLRILDEIRKSGAKTKMDWALELGKPPQDLVDILSLHDRDSGESLEDFLARLQFSAKPKLHLKAAPIVLTFKELWQGYQWQQQDPEHRSFLPRSANGRWRWFRLLMKNHQHLNYISEGRGLVLDQPSLFEWVLYNNEQNQFAAVIGDPIHHSLTPSYQSEYFLEKGIPTLKIQLNEKDWAEGALDILKNLGLKYVAVTSPLKNLAAELVGESCGVNTLYWSQRAQKWFGNNTDKAGLKELLHPFCDSTQEGPIAVWGGRGVLPILQEELPQASFYGATTGQLKKGKPIKPKIVVWAAGRKNQMVGIWPPQDWQPQKVIDLNYSEDSPGKEYALLTGAEYVSGHKMFYAQAQEQRKFWSQCECQ